MKKLLPKMLGVLILVCSCNANKSFLHQRYTHFRHNKTTSVAENKSTAEKQSIRQSISTVPVMETVAVNSESTRTEHFVYTKAVVNNVVLPSLSPGKQKSGGLVCSSSKLPVTKLNKVKPVNIELKHEKRGLLWGVIDGILAIILLVAFVALLLWIIWLYNPSFPGR